MKHKKKTRSAGIQRLFLVNASTYIHFLTITLLWIHLHTQQQPRLNDTNLQIQAQVLHIATGIPIGTIHHLHSSIFPCLYNSLPTQSCYSCALFPQISPGEGFDFLGERVHDMSKEAFKPISSKKGESLGFLLLWVDLQSCTQHEFSALNSVTALHRVCKQQKKEPVCIKLPSCKAALDWSQRNGSGLVMSPFMTSSMTSHAQTEEQNLHMPLDLLTHIGCFSSFAFN